jgi:hypothetical protein
VLRKKWMHLFKQFGEHPDIISRMRKLSIAKYSRGVRRTLREYFGGGPTRHQIQISNHKKAISRVFFRVENCARQNTLEASGGHSESILAGARHDITSRFPIIKKQSREFFFGWTIERGKILSRRPADTPRVFWRGPDTTSDPDFQS